MSKVNRQQRRANRQQARQERKADRQEARQDRKAGRQEARQDRKADRQEARQDRRADRQEARQERRVARNGNDEPKVIVLTDDYLAEQARANDQTAQSQQQLQAIVAPEPQLETQAFGLQNCCSGPVNDSNAPGGSAGSGATATTGSASGDMAFQDLESAVALFESDPEAFFQKMNELPSEERGQWLMMIQQEIQQTNQLVTALTNFQKAQHDTQKAVLANIRV